MTNNVLILRDYTTPEDQQRPRTSYLHPGTLLDFPGMYERRVAMLRENAGLILDAIIAATPERFEDPVKRSIGVAIGEGGIRRGIALRFFMAYGAEAIARYADDLEYSSREIVTETVRGAKKSLVYKNIMLMYQKSVRRIKEDPSWDIEKKVISFLREDTRWSERYCPILKKYMGDVTPMHQF